MEKGSWTVTPPPLSAGKDPSTGDSSSLRSRLITKPNSPLRVSMSRQGHGPTRGSGPGVQSHVVRTQQLHGCGTGRHWAQAPSCPWEWQLLSGGRAPVPMRLRSPCARGGGLRSPCWVAPTSQPVSAPRTSTVWGHNDIYLAKVKPKDYLIHYIINRYHGVTSLLAYMLGTCGLRSPWNQASTQPLGGGARCPPSRRGGSGARPRPASHHSPRAPCTCTHTPRPLTRTVQRPGLRLHAIADTGKRGRSPPPASSPGKGESLSSHTSQISHHNTDGPLCPRERGPSQPTAPPGGHPHPPQGPMPTPPLFPTVRDQVTCPEFLKEFRSFCEDLGLDSEQTVVLSPQGKAPLSAPSGPLGSVAARWPQVGWGWAGAHSGSLCPLRSLRDVQKLG